MPTIPKTGTAWARSLDEYVHTRSLDRPGWAWEFLRRNADYNRECGEHGIGTQHEAINAKGIHCFQLKQRSTAAEAWGLVAFETPQHAALEANVFWHPDTTKRIVRCTAMASAKPAEGGFDLGSLCGRRSLLIADDAEFAVVQGWQRSARLMSRGQSLLSGPSHVTFHIEGLDRVGPVSEALQVLASFKDKSPRLELEFGQTGLRLRECLAALDGHLEGRSYRDIAQVLYGKDRVAETWTSDTRFMKDKVRRAVERGVELMNGGYRKLLT